MMCDNHMSFPLNQRMLTSASHSNRNAHSTGMHMQHHILLLKSSWHRRSWTRKWGVPLNIGT
eukprot:7270881-Ditylum_brightwellii.AAC.1